MLLYHVCITPSLTLSSSLRCGSQGSTRPPNWMLQWQRYRYKKRMNVFAEKWKVGRCRYKKKLNDWSIHLYRKCQHYHKKARRHGLGSIWVNGSSWNRWRPSFPHGSIKRTDCLSRTQKFDPMLQITRFTAMHESQSRTNGTCMRGHSDAFNVQFSL